MALPVPNVPVVNLGNLYIQGLGMSFVTGGLTLGVAAGQARDGTNTNDLVLQAPVVINTAAAGVVNGLDTGTLAANTMYAVYVIGSSNSAIAGSNGNSPLPANSGPAVGCLMSKSFTSPALPFGYDMCRRIGAVLTSGSSLILDFTQAGNGTTRAFWYADNVPTAVSAGNATAFTAISLAASVPVTAGAATFECILTSDAGGDRWLGLRATGSSSAIGQTVTSATASSISHSSITSPVGLLAGVASVDYRVNNAAAAAVLNVFGYVDQL